MDGAAIFAVEIERVELEPARTKAWEWGLIDS
jgi:hypothetical protein